MKPWVKKAIMASVLMLGIYMFVWGMVVRYRKDHPRGAQTVEIVSVDKSKARYKTTTITSEAWSEKIDLDADNGEKIIYVPCVGNVQCIALINEKYELEFPVKQGQVDQNNPAEVSYINEKVKSVRWKIKDGQSYRPIKTAWSTYYGDNAPRDWYTIAVKRS